MIEVFAPAFFPNLSAIRYFLASARRFDIAPHLYGAGELNPHWIATHITRFAEELKASDSELVLFTDARDVIFTASLDEIERRYNKLGSPRLLLSLEKSGINGGQYMGERSYILECIDILSNYSDSDPQVRWRKAFAEGLTKADLDFGSFIFKADVEKLPDRLPCLLHFNGGYSDPDTGREDRIRPVWDALGWSL